MKNEAALTRLGSSFSASVSCEVGVLAAPVRCETRATMAVEKTRPMPMKIQKGSTSVLKWLLPGAAPDPGPAQVVGRHGADADRHRVGQRLVPVQHGVEQQQQALADDHVDHRHAHVLDALLLDRGHGAGNEGRGHRPPRYCPGGPTRQSAGLDGQGQAGSDEGIEASRVRLHLQVAPGVTADIQRGAEEPTFGREVVG